MLTNLIEEVVNKKLAIALVGPTATGKTKVSLSLADEIPAEIVSADSRQIYKYMDIGTAKPSKEERQKVPHHFIDICFPDEYYSAGQYGKEANEIVNKLFEKGKVPLIVGGSGLYIKSLCEGFFEEGYTPEEKAKALKIRKELSFLSRDALYSKLSEIDPETAQIYFDKNYVRLIRALEFYYVKGIPISFYRKAYHRHPDFKTLYIGLIANRDKLYSLINERVERMWEMGLPDEVQQILNMGYSPELNSLNTLGYKETIEYLNGKISKNDAIELIKLNTRRYAKRQITWFKKVRNIHWLDIGDKSLIKKILQLIFNAIENKILSK